MTSLVLVCCLVAETCAVPTPLPRGTLFVLDGSSAYTSLAADGEQSLDGLVERVAGPVEPGAGYRLVVSEPGGLKRGVMLFAPDRAYLLESLVGKTARLTGKFSGGKLWVGKVEPIPPPGRLGADGILARCPTRLGAPPPRGVTISVFRNGAELAQAMRVRGETADRTATELLARQMRLTTIDWNKQTVVALAGGVSAQGERLHVLRAVQKDGTLVVTYQLQAHEKGQLTFPAETILIPRFNVPVKLLRE